MFGIGGPELVFIFVLALLIFGPKRLPQIGRTIGKGMAEFRRASTELQRAVNTELEEPATPAWRAQPAASAAAVSVATEAPVGTVATAEPVPAAQTAAAVAVDAAPAAESPSAASSTASPTPAEIDALIASVGTSESDGHATPVAAAVGEDADPTAAPSR
jgi:sec-independent protein translocase protein TatA